MKKHLLQFVFIFFAIALYGQANKNIENQIKIEENNNEIEKNKSLLTELELKAKVFDNLLANITSDSLSPNDQTYVTGEINSLKKAELKDANKISQIIANIENYKTNFIYQIQTMIYSYQQNPQTQLTELIMLNTLLNQERNFNASNYYTYEGDDYQIKLNEENVNNYKNAVSIDIVNTERNSKIKKIKDAINDNIKTFKQKIIEIRKNISDLKRKNLEIQSELETKSAYDNSIFQWGFPVFIVFILILYLLPLWFLYKKQAVDGDKILALYKTIYGSGLVTEIITVFLLTSTILLLGITDKLSPEILGTLIGGISGYVLGRSFNGMRHGSKENKTAKTE